MDEVTKTYTREKRLLFAPSNVERAKPTLVQKETSTYHHEAPLQEEARVGFDTYMADLAMHKENKSHEKVIKEKEV